ncbi:MAG TPA: hypothetical protein VL463_11015 [Kofleriaceae bacterium]|nr:hypothetical protein [Kofleriaceae bacterium]
MLEQQTTQLEDDDIIEIVEAPDYQPTVRTPEGGKVGYAIAWLLGVPLPILLIVYLISRC